jgi:hypothetical protein
LNGPVLIGVSIALACLVVLVGARAIRRRRRDEIRSVDHYHVRLDTLHVEPHDRGGSVRVVDEVPPPIEHVDPERPRLDPASANLAPWDPSTPPEQSARHDRTWALDRMQTRSRVDTVTVVIVAIVVAVLAAIAFAGYLIERGRTTPTTTPAHAALLGSDPEGGARVVLASAPTPCGASTSARDRTRAEPQSRETSSVAPRRSAIHANTSARSRHES